MKKRLLTGLSLTFIGSLSAVWVSNLDTYESLYSPRSYETLDAKGSQEYLNMMRANQNTGTIDPNDVLRGRQQAMSLANKTSSAVLEWEELGPFNFGGRTRDLIIDRNDSNVLYAGSVSGGLFKSMNKGLSWAPVSVPVDANKAVTGIAQTSNGDIYYGTGEGIFNFYNASGTSSDAGFMGGGVYKSTDNGQTFSLLPSTKPTLNSYNHPWAHIADVEADVTDPNKVYVGTASAFMVTTDGGSTWNNAIGITGTVTDFEVASDGSVWVNIDSKTYYSANGDAGTYSEISKSLPGATDLPRGVGRQAYGVSHSDPDYVYVCQIDGDGGLRAVYRTTDRGTTWTKIGERSSLFDPFYNGATRQGNYDLLVGVDPFDKEKLFLGGIDLWVWDGSWSRKTQWNALPLLPFYLHADQHRIIFDPNVQGRAYHVSDGGVAVTNDGGQSWTQRNKNYSTIQFYNISYGPNDELIGGAQDNGTHYLKIGERQVGIDGESVQVFGGDGGFSEISKIEGRVYFAETPNGSLRRSGLRGDGWETFYDTRMTTVRKPGNSNFASWVMPYYLHESFNDTLSTDSISFGAFREAQFIAFGNGTRRSYEGTLETPQTTAKWVADSFKVVSGDYLIEWDPDSNKYVSEWGSATFDPATGDYTVNFSPNKPAPFLEITGLADVYYDAGDAIQLETRIGGHELRYNLPQAVAPRDTFNFQDPISQAFIVGLTNYNVTGGGIWMTRNPNNIGGKSEWWRIGNIDDGDIPQAMTMSFDGDILFVGTENGNLYRLSNISHARDGKADIDTSSSPVVQVAKIRSFGGRSITSVSVDPNNNDAVIVTLGNYGNNAYVYYSSNATQASPVFASVQSDLPQVPVYSSVINYFDGDMVIVGTELGIYSTDNINAGVISWGPSSSNGIESVPVFTLKQQINTKPSNGYIDNGNVIITDSVVNGTIFAGSYGRGFWKTGSLAQVNTIGLDENYQGEIKVKGENLKMYPNPAFNQTTVDVNLVSNGSVEFTVTDLNGRIVAEKSFNNLNSGEHRLRLELNGLKTGTYIVNMEANNTMTTGKLVIVK